jgi:hypothetical protein
MSLRDYSGSAKHRRVSSREGGGSAVHRAFSTTKKCFCTVFGDLRKTFGILSTLVPFQVRKMSIFFSGLSIKERKLVVAGHEGEQRYASKKIRSAQRPTYRIS